MLMSGCTTRTQNHVVTQYQTDYLKPPAAYLLPCSLPFSQPPQTYGAAVMRDPVWVAAFSQCAFQVEALRQCYQQADTPKSFDACLDRFGAANTIQAGESSRVNRSAAPTFSLSE